MITSMYITPITGKYYISPLHQNSADSTAVQCTITHTQLHVLPFSLSKHIHLRTVPYYLQEPNTRCTVKCPESRLKRLYVTGDLFDDLFESPLWSHQCRSSNDLGMQYTKCPVLQTTHLLSTSGIFADK